MTGQKCTSFFSIFLVFAVSACCLAGTPVLTRSYDNARTGANTSETTFTPDKVAQGLKKLFSLQVTDDPRIEAQPLYVPGITMNDGQKHDVVYVFSMANTVWAFDANTGARIWPNPVSLGTPFKPKVTSAPGAHRQTEIDLYGINILWGILSTPVIDLDTQTMYVVNWGMENGKRVLRLHGLALSDGKDRKPALPISGAMKNSAGQVVKLSQTQKQRAALLLVPLRGSPAGGSPGSAHKTLFVAFTGGEQPGSPRAWVIAFDVDSFSQTASWSVTPNSWGGGIWNGSQGPAADENGNVYVMTGNGGWDGKMDFSESFIKLRYTAGAPGGAKLRVADWFTPFLDHTRTTFLGYDYKDQDLGSGAPVVAPGMNMILGAGKDGVLYVLDRNNMGHRDFTKLKSTPIFFTYFPGFNVPPTGNLDFPPGPGVKTHHIHGSPVFWNSPDHGPMLFNWGENETLRGWTLDATGKPTFFGKSAEVASARLADPNMAGTGGMPGGIPTLSSNGNQKNTGVVWTTAPIDGDANKDVVEGIVRAYDAATLDPNKNADGTPRLKLLWTSKAIPNSTFKFSKFCSPFVADGKLFVATYDGRVDVYTLK